MKYIRRFINQLVLNNNHNNNDNDNDNNKAGGVGLLVTTRLLLRAGLLETSRVQIA